MRVLLYASPFEVRWVRHSPMYCVGVGAEDMRYFVEYMKKASLVILFGCSGYLMANKVDFSEFFIPDYWFLENGQRLQCGYGDLCGVTVNRSVKDLQDRVCLSTLGRVVDQESYWVGRYCAENNVPFISVRYVIDMCDRKVMPWGINHFWRQYQHYRMQTKFNGWLNE